MSNKIMDTVHFDYGDISLNSLCYSGSSKRARWPPRGNLNRPATPRADMLGWSSTVPREKNLPVVILLTIVLHMTIVTPTRLGENTMQTIQVSEFKAKCLALVDQVASSGEVLVVTKNGRPVAEVRPFSGGRGVSLWPASGSAGTGRHHYPA